MRVVIYKKFVYKRIEREKMEKNEQTLSILRHSTSHVMAQAVQKLFPSAKLAIGPAVENGFYYDFDLTDGHAFTHEDLVKIEEEMKNIVKQNLSFEKYVIPDVDKQIAEFKAEGEIYKAELLEEHRNDKPTLYLTKDKDGNVLFNDLCAGPHLPNTSYIKLTHSNFLKLPVHIGEEMQKIKCYKEFMQQHFGQKKI